MYGELTAADVAGGASDPVGLLIGEGDLQGGFPLASSFSVLALMEESPTFLHERLEARLEFLLHEI
jgi:hypothetical protein